MESNKVEATRCKAVAEQKLAKEDLLGAKKFVLNAHELYPSLEGVNHLLTLINIRLVTQVVRIGTYEPEPNYYGILQVDPRADESTIRKEYRKLALLLHPDKNSLQGAEAAFKLLHEAYEVLSDPEKRFLHDMKRCEVASADKPPNPRPPSQSRHQSSPPAAAGAQESQQNYGPFAGMYRTAYARPSTSPCASSAWRYSAAHAAGYTTDYEPPCGQHWNQYSHTRSGVNSQSSNVNNGGNVQSSNTRCGENSRSSFGSSGGRYSAAHAAGYTTDYEPPCGQHWYQYSHTRSWVNSQSSNVSNGGNVQSSNGSCGGNLRSSGENVFSWYG